MFNRSFLGESIAISQCNKSDWSSCIVQLLRIFNFNFAFPRDDASHYIYLGLVHTSEGSDGSDGSGVGIGRTFWSSVNRYDGSDESRSGIGRKRNSSNLSDSYSHSTSDSSFWFTSDSNTPCASDSDSASVSVASVNQPLKVNIKYILFDIGNGTNP